MSEVNSTKWIHSLFSIPIFEGSVERIVVARLTVLFSIRFTFLSLSLMLSLCLFLHPLEVFLHLPYELFKSTFGFMLVLRPSIWVLTPPHIFVLPLLFFVLVCIAIELVIVSPAISVNCFPCSFCITLLLLLIPLVTSSFLGASKAIEVLISLFLLVSTKWTILL